MVNVRAEGAQQLQDLSRALKKAGRGDLRQELNSEIREASRPTVGNLYKNVRSIPTKGTEGGGPRQRGGKGLRQATSRGLAVRQRATGVRIVVKSSALPENQQTLPKYLDGEIKMFSRWRHPVYGNRNVWVQQNSHRWFFETIRKHRAQFRKACFRAMDKIADRITE